jgi:hypothetical protein
MLVLEYAYPFGIHIHERNGKFKWIWYEVLENLKNLWEIKRIVENIFKQLEPDILTKAFQPYHFQPILNRWHSPFNSKDGIVSSLNNSRQDRTK